MSTTRTERYESRRLREQRILGSAQLLAREHGYLTLNVADVAKHAGASVGTLYAHFQSKEGLVAALAVHALRGRVETFGEIANREMLTWGEKLVVIVFADFLFSVDHPELFVAEQLGASTAIRKTMPGGVFRWVPKDEFKNSNVEHVARSAIDAEEFKPWSNRSKQAKAIDRGVWTLMSGSSHVWNVMEAPERANERLSRLPEWLMNNTCALLRGYGWRSKKPEADIQRLAKYSVREGRLLSPSIETSTN